MFIEKLNRTFRKNEPIFTEEILSAFSQYSRPRVFQFINKAEGNGELVRFDTGVYYLPIVTEFGRSKITAEQVAEKKYVKYGNKIFGIYGRLVLELNFLLSTQVPNTIEIITNNEARRVREVLIGNRPFILRKARCPIDSGNYGAYTIMELFSNMDMRQYQESEYARKEIIKYMNKERITSKDLFSLASSFPARTTKNIVESGVLNDIA